MSLLSGMQRCIRGLQQRFSSTPDPLRARHTQRSLARSLSTSAEDEYRAQWSTAQSTLKILSHTENEVVLDFGDSHASRFDYLWLHDHCTCDLCMQRTSGQKLRGDRPSDLAALRPRAVRVVDSSMLEIEWPSSAEPNNNSDRAINAQSQRGHTSRFSAPSLHALSLHPVHRAARAARRAPSLWPRGVTTAQLPTLTYASLAPPEIDIGSNTEPRISTHAEQDPATITYAPTKARFDWYRALNRFGAALVTGVPPKIGAMKSVAQILGPLMSTVYGELFDVVAVPTPLNVAYSPLRLEPHSDILYYEGSPGLQLLHCIRFDDAVKGGETTLLDAFAVARELQRLNPQAFNTLTRVKSTFHKVGPVHHFKYRRTHIDYDQANDEILGVYWSPPFEGPLECDPEDVRPYYLAYRQMSDLMANPDFHIRFRLKPGDMISFNNRRILHARDEFFVPEGCGRHLQGTYIRLDEHLHQYRLYLRQFAPSEEHLDVHLAGNQSY